MAYEKGEFFDAESKQPHMSHILWNVSRILDVHYLGNTHMKDGKDWYHQPLREELPTVPTLENFASIWGFTPGRFKKTNLQLLTISDDPKKSEKTSQER